jgi:hypothetical protein
VDKRAANGEGLVMCEKYKLKRAHIVIEGITAVRVKRGGGKYWRGEKIPTVNDKPTRQTSQNM